jgi:nickel/cobalt exporter
MEASTFELPGRLQHLLTGSANDPTIWVTAMALAFFLGAVHALTPGHGKAIVAAYLVGSRGRVIDAVSLGGIVTFTHTFTVFVLGLATLFASQHVALDRIYPWLSLASGLLVAGIGGWLLWTRLRGGGHGHHHHHHEHHHHDHEHEHVHDHHHTHDDHSHDHHHDHHDHHHDHHDHGKGGLLSLGISGGLVPCPEAMVVLMLSITLRKLAFGLALLVSFSLGLASVLIAIGVAMVLAGPALKKFTGSESRLLKALPVGSAVVVTILGIGLVMQAARQIQ